ncbi:MAG: YkvA family protein [Actinomycetota bacterium]|nr:DUF1232 domain-containing protein [Actinomycetota bacterium]
MTDKVKSSLKSIPKFGKLLIALARDPRVPRKNKIFFWAIAAYLVVPFDLIPDWLPGIGQLDDLVLIALALDTMVNRIPEEIIKEHWDGEEDVLELIRTILAMVTNFVPERIKKRIFTQDEQPNQLTEE